MQLITVSVQKPDGGQLSPVLKVINILLGKLATLANAFKSFTELITGKKSSGQTSGSGAGLAGTDAIADTADQYGGGR